MSRPSKDSGSAPLGVDDLIRLAHLDFGIFAVVMFGAPRQNSSDSEIHKSNSAPSDTALECDFKK